MIGVWISRASRRSKRTSSPDSSVRMADALVTTFRSSAYVDATKRLCPAPDSPPEPDAQPTAAACGRIGQTRWCQQARFFFLPKSPSASGVAVGRSDLGKNRADLPSAVSASSVWFKAIIRKKRWVRSAVRTRGYRHRPLMVVFRHAAGVGVLE